MTTLQAGRELDALVAEKVMNDIPGKALGSRHYSTDMAAAWEVVTWLQAKGWAVWIGNEGEDGTWTCLAGPPNPNVILPEVTAEIETDADTAPLAICLAALKAVGS